MLLWHTPALWIIFRGAMCLPSSTAKFQGPGVCLSFTQDTDAPEEVEELLVKFEKLWSKVGCAALLCRTCALPLRHSMPVLVGFGCSLQPQRQH